MRVKEHESERSSIRFLGTRELDRRIDALIADIARRPGGPDSARPAEKARPRPISPRELVRRMRPFIVLN